MFFLVVAPINALMARRAKEDPDERECPECTRAIPLKARRCPECTAEIEPATAQLGPRCARRPGAGGGPVGRGPGGGGSGRRRQPRAASVYESDSPGTTEMTRPRRPRVNATVPASCA